MSTDVRFFGVAPHWYFRPFMGWLVVCPFYYWGLLGLFLFFCSFYFLPNIISYSELYQYVRCNFFVVYRLSMYFRGGWYPIRMERNNMRWELFNGWLLGLFCGALWYVFSYLPYGRFFNSIGGNNASLVAYIYIYFYLSGGFFRSSFLRSAVLL
jgi:hypothetical protein